MGPIGLLQELESDGLEGGFDLLQSGSAYLLKLCSPLGTHEVRKGLVAGDVD